MSRRRSNAVKITFLGGLGEIGRNCACIEIDGRILLLDVGLMFPELDMLGIDLVLPDFTYLRDNAERIDGAIITHGHEDHMGALSYLLRELSFPIYGSALSLGLARNRIEEAGLLDRTELIPVRDGERRLIGPCEVEFIPVTHSVPHGFATAFHTPQGTILHSGDFKLDLTPVDGRLTDLARIGALASGDGIRLLLSDSTNADEPGHSRSETSVGQVLYNLFHQHEGRRIVIACFASHIHRVQQIADAAVSFGRKVATLGMSVPNFWLGIVAIILFAVQLRWLPASGIASIGKGFDVIDRIRHLILPAGVLAFGLMPNIVRVTRAAVLEVKATDYVRTARSKGLRDAKVLRKHMLRNAFVPVTAMLGLITTVLFSGSVVIESVFGYAGIGRLAIEAANGRDYPVILGVTMLAGTVVVMVNLIVDLLYVVIDPRIRHV